ncbi:MAG TPA: hypothetical protein VD699_03715 [Nitrosopumilaceae archaeon]|nr:hypothetical protein [Nitrosopumilaceae archaeon]
MELKNLIQKLSLSSFPSGLGGCRSNGMNFECCEYNISIFDNKKGESIHEIDGEFIKLHHGSLSETHPAILRQFENMQIISDEQWKLRMFLTEIKEKQTKISNSYTQSCLVDAGVYATKAKEAVKTSDPLAPIWIKCSAYFLTDAISLINFKRPSPTHMLESIRGFQKNRINKNFETVHQCLGIERASTLLLNRMLKSTIGFSDMVEANNHSKIIERKYNHLVQNSFLSDCYFYLGYINRNNLIKIKDLIHRKPDLIHILRVAFDIESDLLIVEQQSSTLLKTINEILSTIKNRYV